MIVHVWEMFFDAIVMVIDILLSYTRGTSPKQMI